LHSCENFDLHKKDFILGAGDEGALAPLQILFTLKAQHEVVNGMDLAKDESKVCNMFLDSCSRFCI